MNKIEEKYKRKYMRLVDNRICELLDHVKYNFLEHNNCEDLSDKFETNLSIIKELKTMKTRIWRYKWITKDLNR